ncbi:hypothetical protein AVEN_165656-1 [Araneus ventricosus]|uniref:Uncharacterized protein n=1 Tax=Araneus ventricosus TaxID=182803 RepID=A0A4Y2UKT3_ARAVE|nr:hypothetical protein AVEN_165656-1 [Araneus ventricosus]
MELSGKSMAPLKSCYFHLSLPMRRQCGIISSMQGAKGATATIHRSYVGVSFLHGQHCNHKRENQAAKLNPHREAMSSLVQQMIAISLNRVEPFNDFLHLQSVCWACCIISFCESRYTYVVHLALSE